MDEIQIKSRCTGCAACENVCPISAIKMEADIEGFLYPQIDDSKCVDCGKCKRICPVYRENKKGVVLPSKKDAYLCYISDFNARVESSSGGIFYAMAMKCLNDGGIVFGARFDEHWNVIHASASDKNGIKPLQVSKYVQSDIGNTYNEAKKYLDSGKNVLYSGTPCQIAGLKTFLGKDYPNLVTCDFICHGVPSPAVWRDYVAYREEKAGAKAVEVCFRVKDDGWLKSFFFFFFLNKEEYRQYKTQDIYYKGFLNNLFVRPSCHHCSFKGFNRASDITIADAWGIKEYAPDFYDDKGVSFVIVHTSKGAVTYETIQDIIISRSIEIDKPMKHNMNFYNTEVASLKRRSFFANWKNDGIESAIESNLKFYDKLYRKSIGIIKGIPRYLGCIRSKRL